MTDWRGGFRAELLCAWQRAGLPDPGRHERAYDELRAEAAPPILPVKGSSGALDPATLKSVFGFGYVIGVACAKLLGIRGRARPASVSWCARFNLGISLVDWLCDEAKVPWDEIAALPAFAPLVGRHISPQPPARAETRYLDSLAQALLAELARDAGPPSSGEPRSALWPSLRRMLRAELASAEPGFFDPAEPTAKLPLLRLKSAEPFRVMAERTALGSSSNRSSGVAVARRLGRAIGECVWLADDAADLWHDLSAKRGNRFLAEAAAADSRVLAADGETLVDIAVVRVLRRERVAERLCARAVGRLAAALRDLPCDPSERERAAGLVGVSLARWTG